MSKVRGQPRPARRGAAIVLLAPQGKVGIPDHVLNKPGALSEEEPAWIQQHPVVGSEIVGPAPSLRGALEVIRQHHERFDGHGYPDGRAGERSRWPPGSSPWSTCGTR